MFRLRSVLSNVVLFLVQGVGKNNHIDHALTRVISSTNAITAPQSLCNFQFTVLSCYLEEPIV